MIRAMRFLWLGEHENFHQDFHSLSNNFKTERLYEKKKLEHIYIYFKATLFK